MTTYYISTSGSDGGTGTQNDPFRTLHWVLSDAGRCANNTILLKAGETFDERVELGSSTSAAASGWRLTSYGTGAMPIVTGAKRSPVWTQDVANDCWYHALALNIGGIAMEDGDPMTYVAWNTNIATTRPGMTAHSFTFDPVSFRYYIVPVSGTPSNHTYALSAGYDFTNTANTSDWTVEGIEFQIVSQGYFIDRGARWKFQDNTVRYCGGWNSGSQLSGNGIGPAGPVGTVDSACKILRNTISDVFDAGIGPQLYGNTETLQNIDIESNTITRCGGWGIETGVTNTGPSNIVLGMRVRKNTISNSGRGWSGNRGGIGIVFVNNDTSGADSKVDGGLIFENTVSGCISFGIWAINLQTAAQLQIRRNTVTSCSNGISISGDALATPIIAQGNVISSCTNGIYAEGAVSDDSLYGNTIYSCTNGIWTNKTGGTMTIKNNMIYSCTVGVLKNGTVLPTIDHNAMFGNTTNFSGTAGADTILTDPLLVNNQPSSASPIYRLGVHLNYTTDKNKRQFYNPPTIGAYEVMAARTART